MGASVDLGSNSVHLLVAQVTGHRLVSLVDESVFLGLGTAVVRRGHLGRVARAELVATLVRYADVARGLGASDITFLGTEPIRRAADTPSLVHEVALASGVPLHVLSHEEEAFLTIIGVTEGMPVLHETLVVDIGGGSSEFAVVDARRAPRAVGMQLGSSRLTDQLVATDPPTPAEIKALWHAALQGVLRAPEARPAEIIAVGGTASNLLKVIPAAFDRMLTRDRIAEAVATLVTEPAAAAALRHRMKPIRARLLPAGGAILDAILARYGADRIRVSDAGLREGAILAVAHSGRAWRDGLTVLAHGWRT